MFSLVSFRFHKVAVYLALSVITTATFAQTFAKKQTLFTGPSPYGIKAADVNKDGNQDLIWISSEHNIEVRMGHGDGTFALSGPIYDTKLRSNAVFLRDAEEFEVADMNGDGKADIVVAGGRNLSVLRGNGDGTFQAPILFALVSSNSTDAVDSLALGDFNKDGKVDAVVSVAGTIQLASGNGNATFQSPPKVLPSGLEGQGAGNVEAGDLDGDGNLDIVFIACCHTDEDHLFGGSLLAWFGDSRGNFPVENTIASGLADIKLKVFDINRDGKLDIVNTRRACMDSCGYGVETWLGHSTRTFTHYTAGVSALSGYEINTGVTFGDFDLDGILDLATGAGNIIPDGFLMFRRLPNNTIADPIFRSVQSNESLSDTEIISADFNHDRKPDVALTYSLISEVIVMVNTTTPAGSCSDGPLYSIHLCSPGSGSMVPSPVSVSARVNSDRTLTGWKVYVDGVAKASGAGANVNASITLAPSTQRRITVKAWDASGREFSTNAFITVR